MLYALIGSGLLGALSTAFLLWRKSVVETSLAECRGQLKSSQDTANRALEELASQASAYQDQLARQRDQISTLRTQRDQAIEALAKGVTPGSIVDLLRGTANTALAKKP